MTPKNFDGEAGSDGDNKPTPINKIEEEDEEDDEDAIKKKFPSSFRKKGSNYSSSEKNEIDEDENENMTEESSNDLESLDKQDFEGQIETLK
jgi:hypothetical protein